MTVDHERLGLSDRDSEREAMTTHEREDQDAGPDVADQADQPDVLLDVPELRVEEISLEVDDLRARVSLQADVLSLVQLHIGVEAELGKVKLDIKGVEAQVLLKARLDNVAKIIERVMTTIDNNPSIVEQLLQPVEEVGEGGAEAVGELGAGAGQAAEKAGEQAGSAVSDLVRGTATGVADTGRGAGEAVDKVSEEAPRGRQGDREPPRQPTERALQERPPRGRVDSPGSRPAKRPSGSRPRRSEED